jgi:hypothetical protein
MRRVIIGKANGPKIPRPGWIQRTRIEKEIIMAFIPIFLMGAMVTIIGTIILGIIFLKGFALLYRRNHFFQKEQEGRKTHRCAGNFHRIWRNTSFALSTINLVVDLWNSYLLGHTTGRRGGYLADIKVGGGICEILPGRNSD